MSNDAKHTPAKAWRRRVVRFLALLKCRCLYLGDGDTLECERCILLRSKP